MWRLMTVILVAAMVVSCRSTRKIGTAISRKDSVSTAHADSAFFIRNTIDSISANRIDFTTFSAKMNIDYRDADGKNYDVNATVRMYRDSAVWISVNAILGIEALRMLVTKDSVKLLDKQNKQYTARSVDYLQDVVALPLDLKTVQDLLIGNPVFVDSNIISYSQAPGTVSLISVGQWFKNLLTVGADDKLLQRSKLDDVDVVRNRTAELSWSDYEKKNGPLFPTKRRILVVEKKNLDIRLDFKQYAFNEEVSFPFAIPKNFKRN